MSIFHAVLLGIVEGITEFLPISSTGHLILASDLLHIVQTPFVKSFEIAIQLGAILAVIALYREKLRNFAMLKTIIIAFVPTGIIGLLAHKLAKAYLLGNTSVVLVSLAIGGILLIALELRHTERGEEAGSVRDITTRQALVIGCAQSVAIIPGVSRSAATIAGGLALGLRRETIVEFSFLLAVPTMLAATGFDFARSYTLFSYADLAPLAAGFITSFAIALIAVSFLLRYIRTNTMIPFGIYRIAIACVFWLTVAY